MKTIIIRLSLIILLGICGLLGQSAKAQFVVTDPGNFWGNLVNSGAEIAQAMEQLRMAENQFQQTKEMFEVVRSGVRTYQGVKDAYNALSDLQRSQARMVSDLSNNKYLTVDERLNLIEGCSMILKYATKDLSGLSTALEGKDKSQFQFASDKERIDMIQVICDKLVEYRSLSNYYTQGYRSISQMRKSKATDRLRFDMLNGQIKQ